ncbi:MAG TPA: type IV pilus modification protein PilV [Chromatiaceae bacterium]|nr:type IV pilus modification protein PilV [Chromatiaceae bacterium]
MKSQTINSKAPQLSNLNAGFTMIEVLVTVLILSVGILAAALLQLKGMQYASESSFRTQAAYIAQEVVDRIRSDTANPRSIYEDIECWTNSGSGAVECLKAGTVISTSTTDINELDILDWGDRITRSHPLGRVRVCHGAVTTNTTGAFDCDDSGDVWTVTIMWDEGRSGATGVNCGADLSVDLQCYSVNFVKL